jgi:hypothetical protein
MKRAMTKGKKSSGRKSAQSSVSKVNRTGFSKFLKEYGTEKNLYKAAGIASAIGVAGFLAFKYVPWEKIADKFEEGFNEAFGEGEFNSPEVAENSAL